MATCLEGVISSKYIQYDFEKQEHAIRWYLDMATNYFIEMREIIDWEPYRFEQVAAVVMTGFLSELFGNYKHISYKEEAEFRIERTIPEFMCDRKEKLVLYRQGASTKIPYMILETKYQYFKRTQKDDTPEPTFLTEQFPVSEVVIGPNADHRKTKAVVKKILAESNYPFVKIRSCR
jgi:hypothetical protein